MSDKIDFKLPAGFSVPEGKTTGDTIEIMATLKLEDGGMACLTKLGDTPLYDEKDEKEKPEQGPENSDFISAYQNQMAGAGGGAQSMA